MIAKIGELSRRTTSENWLQSKLDESSDTCAFLVLDGFSTVVVTVMGMRVCLVL